MVDFHPSAKGIKFSIFVIEDDRFLGDLVVRKLVQNGFDAPRAADGEEAIEYLKNNSPHLILLDLRIPKKDGFEVLEWLRRDSQKAKIPVIVLSNLNRTEDIERATQLGAKEYLVKVNHTPEEVVEKILHVLHETYF
jgi:DNA-binding response OmpR family regulator